MSESKQAPQKKLVYPGYFTESGRKKSGKEKLIFWTFYSLLPLVPAIYFLAYYLDLIPKSYDPPIAVAAISLWPLIASCAAGFFLKRIAGVPIENMDADPLAEPEKRRARRIERIIDIFTFSLICAGGYWGLLPALESLHGSPVASGVAFLVAAGAGGLLITVVERWLKRRFLQVR
jgi:hypothetical protein